MMATDHDINICIVQNISPFLGNIIRAMPPATSEGGDMDHNYFILCIFKFITPDLFIQPFCLFGTVLVKINQACVNGMCIGFVFPRIKQYEMNISLAE